jgi:microcystin-dependent protein
MAQPYVGEIRMFAGNFAPAGWLFCEGQLLPISENEVLFQLIGTTYGGDGESTFSLPDLQGRIPIHQGTSAGVTYTVGEKGGAEEITLTVQQIPTHNHGFVATSNLADVPSPANAILGISSTTNVFFNDPPSALMAVNGVSGNGGSQPHTNFQPYLCVNFIISLFGIFPSQS